MALPHTAIFGQRSASRVAIMRPNTEPEHIDIDDISFQQGIQRMEEVPRSEVNVTWRDLA